MAFAFVHLEDGPKYFVSGALVGAGLAGVLTEVFTAPDRRESERRLDELRGGNVGSYRLAYRMGEFVWGFYAHLSKGETTHREVTEFLRQGESLGIEDGLQAMISRANNPSETIDFNDIKSRVEQAFTYKGQLLERFFDIGWYVFVLRGDDAKTDAGARNKVGEDLKFELDAVSAVISGVSPHLAWTNIQQLWDEHKITDAQVDRLLLALHGFFTFLEDDQKEYQRFKQVIVMISEKELVQNPAKKLPSIMHALAGLGL
ncbi:hypothetical protein [Mycobacterium sp. OAE908]|uniref:hypothetical protein n=1 Tax=Mycobacterium sp. OAE908 TaxID=2817899 RepID=UPI001AE6816D